MTDRPYSDWAHRIARTAAEGRCAIQDTTELGRFLDLIRGSQVVVEIGTLRGGTFYALSQAAAPDALCVSIDLPPHMLPDGDTISLEDLERNAQPGQRIVQIHGDSHASATKRRLVKAPSSMTTSITHPSSSPAASSAYTTSTAPRQPKAGARSTATGQTKSAPCA